jgi:hypothetical protein
VVFDLQISTAVITCSIYISFVPPMAAKHTKLKFPLWQYLNQPLFSRDYQLELHPGRFAYSWRIGLLKRCWYKECDAKGHQQS